VRLLGNPPLKMGGLPSEASRNVLFDQMAYYLAQHRVEFDKDVEKAVSAPKKAA